MNLKLLKRNWDLLGKQDPLFAILCFKEKRGERWNEEEFFKTGETEVRSVLDDLRSLKVKIARGRALDFGCGVGRLTRALAQEFDHATGVDIAPSMITLAQNYNLTPGKCAFHLNTTGDLSRFENGTFDFIYSNITLQHMEPQYAKGYIREFARVLAPGGALFFQIPAGVRTTKPAPNTLRSRLKRLIPAPLYRAYYAAVHYVRPVIEMHAIPKDEVLALLVSLNLTVRRAAENENAGPNWISYEYCATKSRAK